MQPGHGFCNSSSNLIFLDLFLNFKKSFKLFPTEIFFEALSLYDGEYMIPPVSV